MKEYYAVIPKFESYEASNLGNIRNRFTGRILSQSLNRPGGYYRVKLKDGKTYYVHRLVAMAFFEEDISNKDVNHIDGDHYNNHLSNLEIVSRRENIQHAWAMGLSKPSRMKIVTCKYCIYRYSDGFCSSHPDDWYCADARLR